jgi:ankyrin repeat protein
MENAYICIRNYCLTKLKGNLMAKKERLKDFEIMTMDSAPLIEELKNEIEGRGNLKYIKELLEWGHFDVNEIWLDENEQDWSFLVLASILNKPKIVKILLDAGADPNLKHEDGDAALMWASSWGHSQVVQVLLSHPKTDPNIQNQYGEIVLMMASNRGHSQVVQEILKHPSIDINLQDSSGSTALHHASNQGHSQAVQVLLEHPNIDPNLQNQYGNTALHFASGRGHSQVVEELLKRPNIDIEIKNNDCETAWDRASKSVKRRNPMLNPYNVLLRKYNKEMKQMKMLKTLLEKVSAELPEKSKNLKKIKELLS